MLFISHTYCVQLVTRDYISGAVCAIELWMRNGLAGNIRYYTRTRRGRNHPTGWPEVRIVRHRQIHTRKTINYLLESISSLISSHRKTLPEAAEMRGKTNEGVASEPSGQTVAVETCLLEEIPIAKQSINRITWATFIIYLRPKSYI